MSDIFTAYLAGDAREFYADHFADAADRRRAVVRAARPLDAAVATALERQNAGLAPSSSRDANLAALRRGAAAVVTGQQVGLFLGPLFNLYKAASAIVAARVLARETGEPVVPIFWLQSEDHDLPEIAECHVPREHGGPLSLGLPASPDDRISIAHQRLPKGIDDCIEHLRREIDNLPHAADHLVRLKRHYRTGAGWVEAFVGMAAEIFAADGLIWIDPRDPALAAAAAPVHRRALEHADAIAGALYERSRILDAAGFQPGVHIRLGSPLSFFHPRGPAGPRYRLEPAGTRFTEVGGAGVHSRAALLDALASDPLHFSTSVLLRPVLQDTLLPTAAYVGGPGEVAYFAQLPPLYAAYGMTMPLVVPRARLGIVEAKTARALARLGLDPSAADRTEEALLAAARGRDEQLDVAPSLLAAFDAALRGLRPTLEEAGPGMRSAIEKTRVTVESAVARLAAKYDSACLHRDQDLVRQVRWLKLLLHPQGVAQERFYNLSYFAARYGERSFVEAILAAIDPFAAALKYVFPTDEQPAEDRR